MTYPIRESFQWMTPLLQDQFEVGKGSLRIKGVALTGGEVSGNNRKYVDDELIRAARTLIGKPININHQKDKIIGHVDWANYDSVDRKMEYVGQIKKEPYISMVKNRDRNIRGVSIDAGYLYPRCTHCGEDFLNETELGTHIREVHHLDVHITQPFGMIFDSLALVLSPEAPGCSSATVEAMETARTRIYETLIHRKESSDTLEKARRVAAESPETHVAQGITQSPRTPQATQKVEEAKVKEANPPQEKEDITEVAVGKIELTFPSPINVELPEDHNMYPGVVVKTLEKLSLGEPFGGYTDFADCVSKNSGKEDPEAYCATIMRKVEGNGDKGKDKETASFEVRKQQLEHDHVHEILHADISAARNILRCSMTDIQNLGKALREVADREQKILSTVNSTIDIVNTLNAVRTKESLDVKTYVQKTVEGFKALTESVNRLSSSVADSLKEFSAKLGDTDTRFSESLSKMQNEGADKISATEAKIGATIKDLETKVADKSGLTSLEAKLTSLDSKVSDRSAIIALETKLTALDAKAVDKTALKDLETKFTSLETKIADKSVLTALESKLTTLETKVGEKTKTQGEALEALDRAYREYKVDTEKKISEANAKVAEAEKAKAQEKEALETRVDNVEANLKKMSQFKGVTGKEEKTSGTTVTRPWDDKDEKEAK